jgi:acyl-CoA synthetase (AMP-forming)/AMP-acid ligase II
VQNESVTESFTETFTAGLASYGPRPCVEFDGRWFTGDEITAYIAALTELLSDAGVPGDAPLGVVVRNRMPHAAAIIGALAAARPVVMIYSFQSAQAIARDIEHLDLAAVVADPQDWTAEVVAAAVRTGTAGVTLTDEAALVTGHTAQERASYTAALHILTSGTTGPPKRFAVDAPVLEHTVFSVTGGQASPEDPPELVYWPLGGIGGVCQLVTGVYTGKRMLLLEKFSVQAWANAVQTHQLQRSGVQPAVVRMLLDADLDPAMLSSLQFIVCAAGPLDVETRDEFEKRYGIPVLTAYGATEFAGSVCAWTPELYREFGAVKRASSGRPLPGVQVRIVDGDREVPTGRQGVLEAQIPLLGPDWIRTMDIASVDADQFITLHGRADGAINRGGFKILPETVRRVLLSHSGVRDAAVVGVPDERLGQVPFAAVEAVPNAEPTESELKELVRQQLPRHHVPVAIVVVDQLPRNPSLKVSLAAVAALYPARSNT